ncbi:protein kinase domain-containing protein [Floridanema aerugineum]|uniref:AarF/UbiB family protein n=1 Tax=Floridaenema aerugineum BLCC-F46 TaxID=3153654 RepID=A0ABV4X2V0_9CYAN
MKYPLRNEYNTAVRNLDKFVFDSIINKGTPVKQTSNQNFLRSYNGGKAIVYEIQTNTKKYALKCWVEDLGDLKNRYQEIDRYLQTIKISYFVEFSYNEKGILVNGEKFPIIRMEWVDGISFKRFVANNITNPAYIRDFADQFLEMVKILHQNNISHGDLQHGNIMMRENGKICLIDYDSLYVPRLSNERDNIKGLPGYQHPGRNKLAKLSPKSDYFSELIIYLSLLVISENPSYWQQIEQEERLLFSDNDLKKPDASQIFTKLKNLSPEIQYFTRELEKFCRKSDIETLQPLENLVTAYTGSKVSWDFPPIKIPNLSPPPPISIDLNNPAWDILAINTSSNSSSVNVNISNNWDKFDVGSSVWDKFDVNKPADEWGKFGEPSKQPDDSIWDKFDQIWNKVFKSVSSIWNRFVNWFN